MIWDIVQDVLFVTGAAIWVALVIGGPIWLVLT